MASLIILLIFTIILHTSLNLSLFSADRFKIIEKNRTENAHTNPIEKFLIPIFNIVKKNYELVKNHGNIYFRNFDLLHHLPTVTFPEKNFAHDRYLSYQEQCNWMSEAAFTQPTFVIAFSIGYTSHDHEICALYINADKLGLPLVWLDGNIVSRTWLSSAALLSFADKIIFSKDNTAVKLRAKYRFIIVPNLNPDGYEYSRKHNRQWVKNRRRVSNETPCVGVNLNRNFDVGTNDLEDYCSDWYGAEPFSEPETLAVHTAFENFSPIVVSLSFQAYGQMWLLPYACSSNKPENYDEMERVAQIAIRDIKRKNGVTYGVGKASEVFRGSHGGTAFDWSKLKMYSKYSYGVVLRPSPGEQRGFEIDAKWIVPTGKDILYGVESVLLNADLSPILINDNRNSSDC